MNGKTAKKLKKLTFDALKYKDGETSSKPQSSCPSGVVSKANIYRTKSFKTMNRARKKNYIRHNAAV